MLSELDSQQALGADYYMGLAIDKAHSCSPYTGVGCVVTKANSQLIRIGAQRFGDSRHLLNILYDRIHEANTTAYLTQEPYLLGELAERELLATLPCFGIDRMYIANLAPGRFAGRWCKIIKSNGIKVEMGVGRRSVGLPARVGETLVSAGRPWITCVLFLDIRERDISCKSFERDFGFEADLARLIGCHSVLLSPQSRNGFSTFLKKCFSRRILHPHQAPIIADLDCDIASEAGCRKLIAGQQTHKVAAMLLPVSASAFRALDARDVLDELIVYQSGSRTDAEGAAHIKLVPDTGKWHLQDYSPLGDSHRFVYRTVIVKHGLAIH